ncbi:MAG: NAD-dependent epimerase/dehydratase family protein [Candidatus Aminicenantales bacterium]
MKVFITGVNGFIGSNLCRYFLERGHEVYGLVRKTSDLHFLKGLNVRLVYGDLRAPGQIDIPRDVEAVVHSASIVSDTASEDVCRTNIYILAVNLVERVRELKLSLKRFIYISTALTLGFDGWNISEENLGKSAEFLAYTRYKTKTEKFFFNQWKENRLPAVVLRPADVYGPHDRTSCAQILRGIERGTPLIVGHGNWYFGFCYIDNLCQATHLALTREGIEGRAYTVTNRELPTWKTFFKGLQEGLHKKQRIYVPVFFAFFIAAVLKMLKKLFPRYEPSINYYRLKRITTHTTYDISRTIAELGYDPDDDTEKQIRSIVSWYLKERENGFIQ